eukprot:TRINITY_DN30801_c0_g1_i1.p1 TRINITY_DN30801_c0_g1~~TRINITY_DN30801_c0_g1_i1.p1  ORF type:complete len:682 (+),score=79.74 TRINITY_DN30801_c0_g1_i1:60-2048(+)
MDIKKLIRQAKPSDQIAKAVLASRMTHRNGKALERVELNFAEVVSCVSACERTGYLEQEMARELDVKLNKTASRWKGHKAPMIASALRSFAAVSQTPKSFLLSIKSVTPCSYRDMLAIILACGDMRASPPFLYNLKTTLSSHPNEALERPPVKMLIRLASQTSLLGTNNDIFLFKTILKILYKRFKQNKLHVSEITEVMSAIVNTNAQEKLSEFVSDMHRYVNKSILSGRVRVGNIADFICVSGKLRMAPHPDIFSNLKTERLSAREVCSVSSGMARLHVAIDRNKRERLFHSMLSDETLLSCCSGAQLATILWSCASIKYSNKELFRKMSICLIGPSLAVTLAPSSVASLLWSACQIPFFGRNEELLRILEASASSQTAITKTDLKTASRISWAVAKLNIPPRFIRTILSKEGFCSVGKASDSATLLWAAAKTSVEISNKTREETCMRIIHNSDVKSIAKIVWVNSHTRCKNSKLNHRLGEVYGRFVVDGHRDVTIQHVAMIGRGLCSMSVIRNTFYEDCVRFITSEAAMQQFDANTVCTLLWCYSKRGSAASAPSEMICALDKHLRRVLPTTSTPQASGLLNSIARLSHVTSISTPVVLHVISLLPSVSPSHHVHLLRSARTLRCGVSYEAALREYLGTSPAGLGDYKSAIEAALEENTP